MRPAPLRIRVYTLCWNAPLPLCAVSAPKESRARNPAQPDALAASQSHCRDAKIAVINRGMNTNMLVLASSLSDHDLLARVGALADKERGATAELVAHLAALDDRPSLYAAR